MSRRLAGLLVILLFACVGCRKSGDSSPGVILLRYNPGSESTEQREKGFLETLAKEYPDIKVLSSDQYAGTTPEMALDKATDVLNKYRDRVTGIFAVCEPNATGVLGALENTGLGGKVKAVVFDPNRALINGLTDDKLHGIVLQDPVTMGYLGVKTMLAHLQGEKVEKRIVTGVYVATQENMNDEQDEKAAGARAVRRRRRAARGGEVSDRRHSQGNDARVLEIGACRRCPGREGGRQRRNPLERPAAGKRHRRSDQCRPGIHHQEGGWNCFGAARFAGADRSGQRRPAAGNPHRDLR